MFAEAIQDDVVHCRELICGKAVHPRLYLGTSGAVNPSNSVIGLSEDKISPFVQDHPAVRKRNGSWFEEFRMLSYRVEQLIPQTVVDRVPVGKSKIEPRKPFIKPELEEQQGIGTGSPAASR